MKSDLPRAGNAKDDYGRNERRPGLICPKSGPSDGTLSYRRWSYGRDEGENAATLSPLPCRKTWTVRIVSVETDGTSISATIDLQSPPRGAGGRLLSWKAAATAIIQADDSSLWGLGPNLL
jgi:hypothetical protein